MSSHLFSLIRASRQSRLCSLLVLDGQGQGLDACDGHITGLWTAKIPNSRWPSARRAIEPAEGRNPSRFMQVSLRVALPPHACTLLPESQITWGGGVCWTRRAHPQRFASYLVMRHGAATSGSTLLGLARLARLAGLGIPQGAGQGQRVSRQGRVGEVDDKGIHPYVWAT